MYPNKRLRSYGRVSYKEVYVLDKYKKRKEQRVLITNTPFLLFYRDFYVHFFRIPEVLNRLEQYREVLKKNELSIPVWLYCSTEKIQTLKEAPRISVLNFIVKLGLLDRYIEKQGWPSYVIGQEFLLSSSFKKDIFEKWALYFTFNDYKISDKLAFYKVHFFLPKFSFSHLEFLEESSSLKDLLSLCEPHEIPSLFQLISPDDAKVQSLLREFSVGHFLERDEGLKWLWPIWKKNEILYHRKKNSFKKLF